MHSRSLLAFAVAASVAAALGIGLLIGRDRSPSTRLIRSKPVPASVPVSASTLHAILTPYNVRGFDPHDVDLAEVAPRDGAIDGVWFVPAGATVPQLAVAWSRGRGEARVWNLTLWTPEKARNPGTRWRPQRLITRSPIPILDWEGNAGARLADVTADGHDDLLVALGIPGSNHVATLVSVFSTVPPYRRIYGFGYQEVDKRGRRAFGRLISETEWGARDGLLWFEEPRGGESVCCPDHFLRYELRWNGHGWDRVSERRIRTNYG